MESQAGPRGETEWPWAGQTRDSTYTLPGETELKELKLVREWVNLGELIQVQCQPCQDTLNFGLLAAADVVALGSLATQERR
jgi:hypothetical protein